MRCFPGGSITGAPKIRAMEIIDDLEPVTRGPYTGALGYLGFNRESQLSIVIRAAVCRPGRTWFHSGAGIVADSVPEAEYEETLAKAAGWRAALARGAHAAGRPFSAARRKHVPPISSNGRQ
jgi:anthranilate/para-aminobenzoate synthase component I